MTRRRIGLDCPRHLQARRSSDFFAVRIGNAHITKNQVGHFGDRRRNRIDAVVGEAQLAEQENTFGVLEEAKQVDLSGDSEYRLRTRTNGTGLPGYQAGWFKLQNGEKALVFVTDLQWITKECITLFRQEKQ